MNSNWMKLSGEKVKESKIGRRESEVYSFSIHRMIVVYVDDTLQYYFIKITNQTLHCGKI